MVALSKKNEAGTIIIPASLPVDLCEQAAYLTCCTLLFTFLTEGEDR